MMRRTPADAEPSREAAVIARRLQGVHIVQGHVLEAPLVAERARLVQRVPQLAVASAERSDGAFHYEGTHARAGALRRQPGRRCCLVVATVM